MHLHLPALNCLTYGAPTPPLSFGTVTPYRRLLWTRCRPTFELNCTLNKINEILVSGGWVLVCLSLGYWKELSSFYVPTMKNCALLNSFTKPSLLTLKNLKSSLICVSSQVGQCSCERSWFCVLKVIITEISPSLWVLRSALFLKIKQIHRDLCFGLGRTRLLNYFCFAFHLTYYGWMSYHVFVIQLS